MFKLLIGLLAMWGGWQVMLMAGRDYKEAVEISHPHDELPVNPLKVAQRPEVKVKRRDAEWLDMIGRVGFAAGALLSVCGAVEARLRLKERSHAKPETYS